MRRYPKSFVVLTALGTACAIPGLFSAAGYGEALHPLLADPMAGLAFIVSAIALFGSGAFPAGHREIEGKRGRLRLRRRAAAASTGT